MTYLSVCIPTYEMAGLGAEFLSHSLEILHKQTFKDFDVVVSDHSQSDAVKQSCIAFSGRLDIRYLRNAQQPGNSSANLNNAIRNAQGTLIKVLFQDDFLYSAASLQDIVDNLDVAKDRWMVTACEHSQDGVSYYRPFYPQYHDEIHLGNNTISSPSVLTIKNEQPLLFDENLVWLMDCDYYKRCHDLYGSPRILPTINVVNRTGPHQISATRANEALREQELQYVRDKYGITLPPRARKRGLFSRGAAR